MHSRMYLMNDVLYLTFSRGRVEYLPQLLHRATCPFQGWLRCIKGFPEGAPKRSHHTYNSLISEP